MPKATPTVSAVLLCYDSEPFIREAVQSALSQDYSGEMELLISDDASHDRTLEIAREVASEYSGAIAIRIIRRETNSGSKSAHLNHALRDASGDILISFDDDDVSRPDRVRRIVQAFAPEDVQAVYSSFSSIDADGTPRGEGKVPHPRPGADQRAFFARVDAFAPGTTLAVRRSVVQRFGPLAPDVHEDVTLPFRASLLGRIVYIPDPLVSARRRAGSLTAELERFRSLDDYRSRMERGIVQAGRNFEIRMSDLDAAEAFENIAGNEIERLREVASRSLEAARATSRLSHPSFWKRANALLRTVASGDYAEDLPQHVALALLPRAYLWYKRRSLGMAESDTPSRPGA